MINLFNENKHFSAVKHWSILSKMVIQGYNYHIQGYNYHIQGYNYHIQGYNYHIQGYNYHITITYIKIAKIIAFSNM